MKRFGALAALALYLALGAAPTLARDGYVIDHAGLLSPATIATLNSRIASFNAQSSLNGQAGKEVVVETVPSLDGVPIRDAAVKAFTDLGVNGVLIFISKGDRKDFIVPDSAGARAGWFSPTIFAPIYDSMGAQFKNEDYDAGVSGAVDSILAIYTSHLSSLGASGGAVPVQTRTATSYSNSSSGGFHLSGFWLIVLLIVAFLVIRSILRAMSAPRPPMGYGGPPAAPGYGPQGYGPGYGGMGGGGSFFSGLLGGLGGAFLGNELFRGGGGGMLGGGAGDQGGSWSGGGGAAPDAGGWSSDAGQADAGAGGSGGDWSGGGFGDSGGGGDFGGGGGGGADSGGGW